MFLHHADIRDEDVVKKAEAGDTLEVISVCGKNGNFIESWPDEDLELPFEAETRILFWNMQINTVDNDATAVSAEDTVKVKPDYGENTDFERMWPCLRDNLIFQDRIKPEEMPENLTNLWMSQKAEVIKGYNDK